MAGPHVVEFSWRGFSVTEIIAAFPWATVLIKRNLRPISLCRCSVVTAVSESATAKLTRSKGSLDL